MAAIGKIREQSTLLLIIIGGAMIAFVLGDLFSNQGFTASDQYVGEVYGEEIDMLEYEQRVEAQEQSMASVGQPISPQQRDQIRNQVWNDMIQEKIMYREMNKLGMRMGQDEYDDIRFGENVMAEFADNQNFKDPETGQFDPKLVQNYFSFLQEQYPLFYETQTNRIVNERLYEKYNNMVRQGLFVNTLEAKDEYYRQEKKVRFQYVVQEYTAIPDSTVKPTEQELKAYYEEHKDEDRFEREAQVDLNFVVFEVLPTPEDEAEIKAELADLKSEFQNTEKDSLFILKYSDSRNTMLQELDATGNEELGTMLENVQDGDVIGPYKMGNRYAIAKIDSVGTEEQATARHILLSNQTGADMETLRQRADSIKKVIQEKNNFEEMVQQFSDDPGSVGKGGKYENFDRQTMVPEFTEASFDKPIGSLNIVETDYGVHIVEPLERGQGNVVKAYVVDADIEPSTETFNLVYDQANEFSIAAGDAEGMVALAEERGYELQEAKDLTPMARNLPGVAASQEAISWAHNKDRTEVGSISEPLEFDQKIVVVGLESRRPAGRAPFENVKEEITPEVIREKKVEMFKEQMDGKELETLASELNAQVKTATNVSEKRPSLPGGASEPYVVGYAISMAEGDRSKPLEGIRGVYVIKLEKKSTVEPREEYLTYKDELKENRQNQLKTYSTGVYRALRDLADVKDERSRMY